MDGDHTNTVTRMEEETQEVKEVQMEAVEDAETINSQRTLKAYWKLLRYNDGFRYLWMADLISLIGDWLNEIASLIIIGKFTDSGLLISLWFISREIAPLIWSPFVGVVIDSFDRRKVMLTADLTRY